MTAEASLGAFVGPVVICVRGPSRSGKTFLIEHLVEALAGDGRRVAYLKRTHHPLDLPGKASARVWERKPSAMVLHAPDRLQLSVPSGDASPASLLAMLPGDVDLVLLETHSPEPYPTILSRSLAPAPGENVIGRWNLDTVKATAASLAPALLALLPADRALDLALRRAMQLHGGHACAGLVLGTRLALHGAAMLGVDVPDQKKRLIVAVETDRCAVDAIQAVTGCRPGKRTLRLLDFGKLAATFIDQWSGNAVRVATRGELRVRVTEGHEPGDRHDVQRLAYLSMPIDELFEARAVKTAVAQFDLPGPPRRRINCSACGEEVTDGREIITETGPRCRPCAGPGGTW